MVLPHPLNEFETADSRHLEIGKDEAGQRVSVSVGVNAFAAHVVDRVLTIGHGEQRMFYVCGVKGSLDEKYVVRVIFDQENGKPLHLRPPFRPSELLADAEVRAARGQSSTYEKR